MGSQKTPRNLNRGQVFDHILEVSRFDGIWNIESIAIRLCNPPLKDTCHCLSRTYSPGVRASKRKLLSDSLFRPFNSFASMIRSPPAGNGTPNSTRASELKVINHSHISPSLPRSNRQIVSVIRPDRRRINTRTFLRQLISFIQDNQHTHYELQSLTMRPRSIAVCRISATLFLRDSMCIPGRNMASSCLVANVFRPHSPQPGI
jgi:hypothetical protein